MNDITELERRINAALDRIDSGLGAMPAAGAAPSDAGELATLQEALESERTANAQMEERIKAIRKKKDRTTAAFEQEISRLRDEVTRLATDTQRLEKVNGQLRANNQALRDANERGVGDPDLINTAMLTELDSLRMSREADRAELDAILGELKPLVEGRADA